MNEPPLDRNENVVDIFVLSISASIGPELTELLEEKGYRVTLFSSSKRLLETLREGKPNLLICDTTTVEDGFEICRRIKADSDLWVIPILIFTSASTLTDLLNVLDCNADNFLAYPSDLPYRLSLIETMLTTPVERQTPELIKTQFKINHEDRIYVVSASRRKILEFLLSSFEIAVNKSSEISELKTEIQRLTESVETMGESVTEHTCVIDLLNASVQQKDQKIVALTSESAERQKALLQKTEEIRKLADELEAGKALLAKKNENINAMIREKEEIVSFHDSETDALRQQVSGLVTQINTGIARLDSVQREFEEEKTHSISLENSLQDITVQKDRAEETLQSLIPEHDHLKSLFDEEKNRRTSLESSLQDITVQKDRAEEILQSLIPEHDHLKSLFDEEKNRRTSLESSLRDITIQKDRAEEILQSLIPEHDHLKSLFDEEKNRRTSLESSLRDITIQKDRAEESLQSLIPEHDHLKSLFDEEKNRRTSLESSLQDITVQKDQAEETLRSHIPEHEHLKSSLQAKNDQLTSAEQEIVALRQAHARSEQELNGVIAGLEKTVEQNTADLTSLKEEIASEKNGRFAAEKQLNSLVQEKEQTEESQQSVISNLNGQISTLQEKYSIARTELETKEGTISSLERNFAESLAEKGKTEEQLRENQVSSDSTIAQLKDTIARENSIRSALEADLESAKNQSKSYAEELALATQGRAESGQRVQSLSDELESVKGALESKETLIKSLREKLSDAIAEKDNTEGRVKTDMESYKTTFIRLKHDLDETLASRRTLEKDLGSAKMQNIAYVKELALANRSKEQSEQQICLLVDELEKVKAELDTERSLHQTSHENLEAFEQIRKRFEQDIRISAEKLDLLNIKLENEQKLRSISEEKTNAAALEQKRLEEEIRAMSEERDYQEHERAQKIKDLKKDLESVCDLQKSLEEEVRILNEEKLKAEQKVQALSLELEQARMALADEWEHHVTSDERLAAAVLEQEKLQQSLSREDLERTKKANVEEIVAKEPDLPVKIEPSSQSLELVISREKQTSSYSEETHDSHETSSGDKVPEIPRSGPSFSGIEDLFEDDEQANPPVPENEPAESREEEEFSPGPQDIETDEDSEYAESEEKFSSREEAVEHPGIQDVTGMISAPAFSFNRRQWLGLIKWAHHSDAISREQRLQIIRMGRLIQRNRKLTPDQEDQINEMIALVQALGYKPG